MRFILLFSKRRISLKKESNNYSYGYHGKLYHAFSNWCHARGVSICTKVDHKLLTVKSDSEGRFLLINIDINGQIYTLVNLYCPNATNERREYHLLGIVKSGLTLIV